MVDIKKSSHEHVFALKDGLETFDLQKNSSCQSFESRKIGINNEY